MPAAAAHVTELEHVSSPDLSCAVSLWIANQHDTVTHIDPQANAVNAEISVGGIIHGLVGHDDALWASSIADGGQLVEIDAASGSIVSSAPT